MTDQDSTNLQAIRDDLQQLANLTRIAVAGMSVDIATGTLITLEADQQAAQSAQWTALVADIQTRVAAISPATTYFPV